VRMAPTARRNRLTPIPMSATSRSTTVGVENVPAPH
jgi:hypothetical protein